MKRKLIKLKGKNIIFMDQLNLGDRFGEVIMFEGDFVTMLYVIGITNEAEDCLMRR